MPEAINWGAIQPQSGGAGRHLTNAPPPMLATWKCVKCSAENQGPLEQGCASCGAGKPGYHTERLTPATPLWLVDDVAFEKWLSTAHCPEEFRGLCRDAWKAGMAYAQSKMAPQATAMPSAGTPESRTLAAALALFIEQVLIHDPDEVEAGEWLSARAAQDVLRRLQGGESERS